ncbi:hypothetical protein I317_05890 [Kwoniella heveanensis CBS 569]|nr:hypothetical protein I317_05890 [Kwoniella heveanensis CBS 569]
MPVTLHLDHLLESTAHEDFPARRQLSDISTSIAKAKRVVVVSGAGISCSSGIPDFRSADGLYSLVKSRYPDIFFTGKDLFSSGLFSNPETTSIFYTFIAELSLSCLKAQPTRTHHFIKRLESKGKLLRSYTQNVDGLERRLGLESGGRGNGLKKKGTRNVELHGDLGRVRCVLCFKDFEALDEYVELFRQGEAPDCPTCIERCQSRINRAARALPIGTLRPSIVLYDEPHPLGDDIGALTTYDLSRSPDVLLIMGTSLKVHGLKRLVKEFAKSVHGNNGSSSSGGDHSKKKGLVVFVNATPPSKEWEGIIDFHIQGETDKWVEKVEEEWKKVKPADWETQTRLDGEVIPVAGIGASAVTKNEKPRPIKGIGRPKPLVASDKTNRYPNGLPSPRHTASPRSPSKHHTPASPSASSSTTFGGSRSQSSQSPSQAVFGGRTTFPKTSSAFSRARSVPSNSSTLPPDLFSDTDSELSDAPPSPPSPPTPKSPTKRRANAFDSPSKKTKSLDSEIPFTGLPATPGRGNLFSVAKGSRTRTLGKSQSLGLSSSFGNIQIRTPTKTQTTSSSLDDNGWLDAWVEEENNVEESQRCSSTQDDVLDLTQGQLPEKLTGSSQTPIKLSRMLSAAAKKQVEDGKENVPVPESEKKKKQLGRVVRPRVARTAASPRVRATRTRTRSSAVAVKA